jgi:hypothetical protein
VSFPEIAALARSVGFVDLKTYRSLGSHHEAPVDGVRVVLSARRAHAKLAGGLILTPEAAASTTRCFGDTK